LGSIQPYKQIAMRTNICRLPVALILICPALPLQAYNVNDQFSINGILSGTGQCQNVSALLPSASYDDDGSFDTFDNACRGALPLQLEASFHPNDANEFFVKFGFAIGNGLNEDSPRVLVPWAANLEDNVKAHYWMVDHACQVRKSGQEASMSINTLQVTFVPCRFYETTNSAWCQVKRLRFWLRGDYEVYGTT